MKKLKISLIGCLRTSRCANSLALYEQYHKWFKFPSEFFQNLSAHAIVLHPLPRGLELPEDLDSDPRLRIFEQVRHGLAIRKVILANSLGASLS